MKIVKKNLDKTGGGVLTIETEDEEDIWHIYNLVSEGDLVTNTTHRKVVKTSSTGSTNSTKKLVSLTIRVEEVNFDSNSAEIRLKGKVCSESEYVKRGVYHTLTIEGKTVFQLEKPVWDAVYLDRVATACNVGASADVAAVVMQQGLGHVCLITKHRTLIRAKVEIVIPKKRVGSSDRHSQGLARFHKALADAVDKHVRFDVVKCLVVASPAHYKDDFCDYYLSRISSEKEKQAVKAKLLRVGCSSGYMHSLSEVMEEPNIRRKLEDTKAYKETGKLKEFFELLNNRPDWAWFGPRHCKAAANENAIECLMVSDDLFRAADPKLRKEYVALVDEVKASGGEVLIYSSLHVSGMQLNKMTGVAAILRTPLTELRDLEGRDPDDIDSEEEEG